MKSPTILLLLLAGLCCSFVFMKKKKGPQPVSGKTIEKSIAVVGENLYASKYEVSNFFYQEFLTELEETGDTKKYEIAKFRKEYWNTEVAYGEPLNSYHTHPAYDEYPVVNVSHEGANLFCEWLTEKYNSIPKRKFKKVKFRLPSESEWTTAAKAGRDLAIFPWGGYNVQNSKGQFLANFRTIPQSIIKYNKENEAVVLADHAFPAGAARFPAPIKSYLPNDFGLFHMSGNVAEMLAENGRTKGGSWASSGYYIRIDAEDEYAGFTEPSPKIGFRYFMEVIEE